MERPMPRYAPELTASVIDQYLHTDKPVELIAREHAIGERDVTRIRHDAGIPPRRTRVRSLPRAMAGLVEARALLRASAADVGRDERREAERIAPDNAGGATRSGYCAPQPLATGADPSASPESQGGLSTSIDRIERLVEQELAAEEAGRAKFGLLPRGPGDAERCARTLAILTKTLQALTRLRGGAIEQGSTDDDDMPADMDEFRNELARRIRLFVQSRTGEGVCGGVESADGAANEP
jgi:hypothetical protein